MSGFFFFFWPSNWTTMLPLVWCRSFHFSCARCSTYCSRSHGAFTFSFFDRGDLLVFFLLSSSFSLFKCSGISYRIADMLFRRNLWNFEAGVHIDPTLIHFSWEILQVFQNAVYLSVARFVISCDESARLNYFSDHLQRNSIKNVFYALYRYPVQGTRRILRTLVD